MTQSQRNAVKELQALRWQHNNNNNNNNDRSTVSSITRKDIQEDMQTMYNAMISGVGRAGKDNTGTETPSVTTEESNSNRNSVDSGNIGNLFRQRNKKHKSSNS